MLKSKVNQIQHYTKVFLQGGKWHWLVFTWVPVEKCGFDMGCEFAKGQALL